MKYKNVIKKIFKVLAFGPLLPILMASPDNVDGEVKFAGTMCSIDSEVVAKVTNFNRTVSVSEENVTGSEDYIPGTDVLHERFTAIAVNETASVEGITIEESPAGLDDGQSELKDAAESGKIVTMRNVKNNGYGWNLTGFFNNYTEEADTTKVYRFKATFRVNGKTEITPGS
jgi:hypothetical protein